MAPVIEYQDFYAHCNHMPGSEKALRAGGTVVFPTTGWSATLKEHERSGPPPTSPLTLELDLVIERPSDGETIIDVLTPVELDEFRIDRPPAEYGDVYVFVDEEFGEGPGQIEVQHTQ